MKFFIIFTIISTIFVIGDSLKCYQCTKGQYSDQEIYRHLPECFDNADNPVCEATSYCVKMTIDNASENHTIIYECDTTANNSVPEGAEELICSTDFCNLEEKGLHPMHVTTFRSTTVLSNVTNRLPNMTSTLSPNASLENSTIRSSASSVIVRLSTFLLIAILFFI